MSAAFVWRAWQRRGRLTIDARHYLLMTCTIGRHDCSILTSDYDRPPAAGFLGVGYFFGKSIGLVVPALQHQLQ